MNNWTVVPCKICFWNNNRRIWNCLCIYSCNPWQYHNFCLVSVHTCARKSLLIYVVCVMNEISYVCTDILVYLQNRNDSTVFPTWVNGTLFCNSRVQDALTRQMTSKHRKYLELLSFYVCYRILPDK